MNHYLFAALVAAFTVPACLVIALLERAIRKDQQR